MIVVQLTGGLGNQLFQYALGRRLAIDRRVPLKLDTAKYARDGLRTYTLDRFNIQAGIATEEDALAAKGGAGLRGKLVRRLERLRPYYRRHWLREHGYGFDPNILKAARTAYLEGYWQSEKYFAACTDAIRGDLRFREPPSPVNRTVADQIGRCESVSVHVRRGDYVSNVQTNRVHGACSLSYYQRCVDLIMQRVGQPHFFVFSDDVEWARSHLHVPSPVTYVDHNHGAQSFEDMRLMSCCKHHIIANSSFSWWGAWLARNPDQIVLAPRPWFRDPAWNPQDILPEAWLPVVNEHA